ncbi:hypothetical protein ACJMK2_022794 [Sinanodonta woodiana]|uniref:Uncharacterized protein n=1 Tax=Sinanodonta woodiana TaxID=1069815 RepID=A0ABD3TL57_SINWO
MFFLSVQNMNHSSVCVILAIVCVQANMPPMRGDMDHRLKNSVFLSSGQKRLSLFDLLLSKDGHSKMFSEPLNEKSDLLQLGPNPLKRSVTAYCQTQECLKLLQQYEQQLQQNGMGVYGGRWF